MQMREKMQPQMCCDLWKIMVHWSMIVLRAVFGNESGDSRESIILQIYHEGFIFKI